MATKDSRKHPRTESHNLLSYVCLDADNQTVRQGMGRTLNVSESGILLETHVPMEPKHMMIFSIAMEDDLLDIRGEIVYNKQRDDGKFDVGIQFVGIDEETTRLLKQFVIIFKEDRESL